MRIPVQSAELLAITGADAVGFAQAQFTSDVRALGDGQWQWSAWLDPAGRVRMFFLLARIDADRLLLWLPAGDAAAQRDQLARFVFRSRVALEAPRGWMLFRDASHAAWPQAGELHELDGGHAVLLPGAAPRRAWIGSTQACDVDAEALRRWRLDDVHAMLPLLPASLSGEFVPQALGLERIDAIRFDKGCYPGQEIAARLHFRGGNKRQLRRIRIEGAQPRAEAGAPVLARDDERVGTILYGASDGDRCLALAVVADHAAPPLHGALGEPITLE